MTASKFGAEYALSDEMAEFTASQTGAFEVPYPRACCSSGDSDLREAANTEGPRGTHGCACLHSDALQCAAIRYGMDHYGEPCECLCHQWDDENECY